MEISLIKLIKINQHQVHVTLMTLTRSLGQRSSQPAMVIEILWSRYLLNHWRDLKPNLHNLAARSL